jgi:hypothetical protein
MKIAILVVGLIVGVLIWRTQQTIVRPGVSGVAVDAGVVQPPADGSHEDHDPKHGGTFFMAMNNHHHLEGVLEAPGIFRVYVYDSFTKPLSLEQMKQVSGTVLVGESDNAPEIPLTLSGDGQTLEAALGSSATLPLTLTLRMRFPGMTMEARPELFTFPFQKYTEPAALR